MLNPMMPLPVKQSLNAKWCRHSSVLQNLSRPLRRRNDPSRHRITILPRKLKKPRPNDFSLAHSDKGSEGRPLQQIPAYSSNGNFESMQVFFTTSVPRILFSHVFYFLSPSRVGIEIFTTVPTWTIRLFSPWKVLYFCENHHHSGEELIFPFLLMLFLHS